MTGLLLALLVGLAAAPPEVYVDHLRGQDAHTGRQAQPGPDGPVRTFARALRLVPAGGTIHLVATPEPYRQPLLVTHGGSEQTPLVVDGHGAVIDLGTSLSAGPWRRDGDEWVYDADLGRVPLDDAKSPGQWLVAGLFVDGWPLGVRRRDKTGPLARGELRYDAERRLRFVPRGAREPGALTITLPAPPAVSAVGLSGVSHVTVRNLTVRYAGNDGFNIHGHCLGIRFEHVRALHCADEGLSAHEDSQVSVEDSEVAFCGSLSGGITDVGDSVTRYTRCLVHHNRGGGFGFEGGAHALSGCVAGANVGRQLPQPSATVTLENCATPDSPAPADPAVRALWERARELAHWPAARIYE